MEKMNLYTCCVDCGIQKFETIVEKELCDSLKAWIIYKTILTYCLMKVQDLWKYKKLVDLT